MWAHALRRQRRRCFARHSGVLRHETVYSESRQRTTRLSWSRERRVVAKAEWTQGEANPRFIVLARAECKARYLYEKVYYACGDMENRIKECQLDLYADRTSLATMQANQLRLWFYSMAYVLLCALRRIGLDKTNFANASCGTLRLGLLKIGARVLSAFAASKSPWRRPARQRPPGLLPALALPPPPALELRPPDTRNRIASLSRHHPKTHRNCASPLQPQPRKNQTRSRRFDATNQHALKTSANRRGKRVDRAKGSVRIPG
jgi:hypothetical protein